jgi:hypothetical protein
VPEMFSLFVPTRGEGKHALCYASLMYWRTVGSIGRCIVLSRKARPESRKYMGDGVIGRSLDPHVFGNQLV